MPKTRIWWFLAFILLYVAHAGSHLALTGAVILPFDPEGLRLASLATLIALVLLVVGYVATQDEVQRSFVLIAAAISAVIAGFLSYGVSAFDLQADYLKDNYWAVAIFIFLIVYGVLSWRGRL